MPLRLVVAVSGGLLLTGAFEPFGVALLMPVALVLLVLVTRGLPARRAWAPGLAFGVAFCFTLMVWMRAVGPAGWLGLSALEAAFFAPLGMALARLQRLPWWPVWTALTWVAVENLRGNWPLSGMPWGRLAHATVDTPWQHSLPWVGATGVSLLVALTGTTLAALVLLVRDLPGRDVRRPVAVAPALAGAVLLTALTTVPVMLPHTVERSDSATLAVVQGDVPGDGTDLVSHHRQVTRNLLEATQDLAADVAAGTVPRPDFVLWPENSTAVDPFNDLVANTAVRTAVAAVDVPVLVGTMVDAPDPDKVLNQGIVWVPGRGATDRYTKHHPVPFGEYIPGRDTIIPSDLGRLSEIPRDMVAGTSLEPLLVAGTRVADAICFDIAYDDTVLGQVSRGAELLTVQTSNAQFIQTHQVDQQFGITRMRAMETGRWVAVASANGISGVITPGGRVVAVAEPRTTEVLVEQVGLSRTVTPAVAMGLWPRRVVAVLALLALLVGVVPYRRNRPAPATTQRENA